MILRSFLLALVALCIFSCQSPQTETEQAPKVSIITLNGAIENPKEESVTLRKGETKITADLDEKNAFTMQVELEEAGKWRFSHGKENATIYLQPDKDLSLSLNTDEFDESLKFNGPGANENTYLIAQYLLDEQLMGNYQALYKSEEAEFIEKTNDARQQTVNLLKEHADKLDPDFKAIQEKNLLYDWAGNRLKYQDYHRYFSKDEEFEVSESYMDFMGELSMEDEAALASSSYKEFWSSYAWKQSDIEVKKLEDPSAEERIVTLLNSIKTVFSNEKVRNAMLYAQMNDVASYEGANATDKVMQTYSSLSTNESDITDIKEKLQPWEKLRKGSPAPDFKYTMVDGKQVALSELKGKSVYIDVWATWCGPCRAEMPSLAELEEKYKDSPNLVFASVSIDSDKEAWEKMVTEKNMQGVQLFADGAWESSICKDYLIKGIPRFILVDAEGNLINVDAPRPSSDEIKGILAGLAESKLTSMK